MTATVTVTAKIKAAKELIPEQGADNPAQTFESEKHNMPAGATHYLEMPHGLLLWMKFHDGFLLSYDSERWCTFPSVYAKKCIAIQKDNSSSHEEPKLLDFSGKEIKTQEDLIRAFVDAHNKKVLYQDEARKASELKTSLERTIMTCDGLSELVFDSGVVFEDELVAWSDALDGLRVSKIKKSYDLNETLGGSDE